MQVAGSLGGVQTGTPPGRYPETERIHGKNGTAPRMAPVGGDRYRRGGGGWRERRSGSQERREPHGSRMRERVETAPHPDSYRIGGDPEIGCKGELENAGIEGAAHIHIARGNTAGKSTNPGVRTCYSMGQF